MPPPPSVLLVSVEEAAAAGNVDFLFATAALVLAACPSWRDLNGVIAVSALGSTVVVRDGVVVVMFVLGDDDGLEGCTSSRALDSHASLDGLQEAVDVVELPRDFDLVPRVVDFAVDGAVGASLLAVDVLRHVTGIGVAAVTEIERGGGILADVAADVTVGGVSGKLGEDEELVCAGWAQGRVGEMNGSAGHSGGFGRVWWGWVGVDVWRCVTGR